MRHLLREDESLGTDEVDEVIKIKAVCLKWGRYSL